jgi:adenylate cyclase, class 2
MSTTGGVETEIKLRAPGPVVARQLLEAHGFAESEPRIFEANNVYDTPDLALRSRGHLLRLRQAGRRNILTWKGPEVPGVHKSRPESEVDISSFESMERIVTGLGYQLVFRYEKFRTEFHEVDGSGTATLDETPIGVFFELEGPPEWIDTVAARLGFDRADYVTASYGALYLEYCKKHLIEPSNMRFDSIE